MAGGHPSGVLDRDDGDVGLALVGLDAGQIPDTAVVHHTGRTQPRLEQGDTSQSHSSPRTQEKWSGHWAAYKHRQWPGLKAQPGTWIIQTRLEYGNTSQVMHCGNTNTVFQNAPSETQ